MEIKREDLMTTCKRCDGRGELETAHREHAVGLKTFESCPECDASGVLLTPSGEAIRGLLEKLNLRRGEMIPAGSAR